MSDQENRILDMDFAEKELGKSHRVMSADVLIDYSLLWTTKLFGYPVSVEDYIDRKRVREFKKMYAGDAGLILKWFFISKHGINPRGERFKFSMLSTYWRDFHDMLNEEAHTEMARERDRIMGGDSNPEFVSALDLVNKFKAS